MYKIWRNYAHSLLGGGGNGLVNVRRVWLLLILCDPAIIFLGIYKNNLKFYVYIKTHALMFKSGFMPNCQNLETVKRSFNRQMDKYSVFHPDNEVIFST